MSDFFKDIDKMVEEIEDLGANFTASVAESTIDQLIDMPPTGTPIKTGWARAGWRVSESGSEGPIGSPTQGGVALAKAAQESSLLRLRRMTIHELKTFYVINPVDYIRDLNMGSSRQSPAMFVEEAVEVASIKSQHWRK
ncbi:hypothetical protein KAR91_78475 [Candidatus Pacearchaeota archaeon]|nr:hypothetical protein [Candidatus Pacearchaeota archaeon]